MKTSSIFFGSILVLLVLGSLGFSLGSQTDSRLAQSNWPPRPEDIVNLAGTATAKEGETVEIFKIPPGRCLVVTNVMIFSPDLNSSPDLVEITQKKSILKFPGELMTNGISPNIQISPYSSCGAGLTFDQGTKIGLRNRYVGNNYIIKYAITGYFSSP